MQPHPRFTAIATDDLRPAIYRRLVLDAIDPDETAAIRLNLQRQHALGNDRFRAAIERQLGRRAGPAARIGRPPKAKATQESAL